VVRPVLRDQEPAPHVSGAAILGSGRVVLVLNPASIVGEGLGLDGNAGVAFAVETEAGRGPRRILVVDDSITTRTLEQSILEAAGYDVLTAADGADGWRLVQEQGCDLVVADVEMPRMDGFALCQAIRGSKRHTKLPVVLVTALETPEHRLRGLEAGADAYLGKSSFDQQALLDTIGQLVG
jgi:two-component system chemotaxis sensor kinase CheA